MHLGETVISLARMSAERELNGPLRILDKQRRRCVTRNEPWTRRSAPLAANELDALSPRRSALPVFLSRFCSHAGQARKRPEWEPLPMVSRSHMRGSSRQERRGKAPQSRSQMVLVPHRQTSPWLHIEVTN